MGKVTDFARKVIPCKSCGAVIVAAGTAQRMGGVDKIMADLGGEPLILRTVRGFQATAVISSLCQEAGLDKVRLVVAGGETRQASVRLGLEQLSRGIQLAAIADAARPLVTPQLIDRVVRAAGAYGAAAPAVPVKDTIKVIKDGFALETPARATLRAVQTPQVFDYDVICGALAKAGNTVLTDDCAAVERLGMPVRLVEGEENNFKVTTRQDLLLARAILQEGNP